MKKERKEMNHIKTLTNTLRNTPSTHESTRIPKMTAKPWSSLAKNCRDIVK